MLGTVLELGDGVARPMMNSVQGREDLIFLVQVTARLVIHKSLPMSQVSFNLFANSTICSIRMNVIAILRRV